MQRANQKILAGMLVTLAACAQQEDQPASSKYEEPSCEIQNRYFRVVDVPLPQTSAMARQIALDIDGDGYPNNHVGDWVSAFYTVFGSAKDTWPEARREALRGSVVWVIRLGECADGYREVSLRQAEDQDGDGRVELVGASVDPAFGKVLGNTVRSFHGYGQVPIGALLDIRGGHGPGWVSALAIETSFWRSGTGLSGTIGFGVEPEAVADAITPAFATFFTDRLEAGTSEAAKNMDSDGDGIISVEEARPTIEIATYPDLDLLGLAYDEGTGQFADELGYLPNADGVDEHMSYTIEFRAEAVEIE